MGYDPYLGTIVPFAGTFAPKGWLFCHGQLLLVGPYQQLFLLLGTQFGGDGVQNFQLPDLRGRCVIGQGQGPGLTSRVMGLTIGSEGVALSTNEMPFHNHTLLAVPAEGTAASIGNNVLAKSSTDTMRFGPRSGNQVMATQALQPEGSGVPHNNMMPSLVMSYIIAVQGIFPPRS